MKRSKAITTVLVCIIGALLLCALGYFVHSNNTENVNKTESKQYSLYFLDSTKTKLVSELGSIEITDDDTGLLENLVELLIAGPKDKVEKKRAIPEATSLISLSHEDGIATVNFSHEFYGETDIDNSLAAATIVKTLCETNIISKVKILVDGQELIGSDKVAYGALGSEDIIDGSITKTGEITLSLYFPGKDGKLFVESRNVTQNDNEPIEKIAVTELIKGSRATDQSLNLIPADAKLLSIEVKGGICFVNFSKEFIAKRITGSSNELLTIFSIVNTLCDFENINKVQFLIEGQSVETYGDMIFNEPFESSQLLVK